MSKFLYDLAQEAVAAAMPSRLLAFLPDKPKGRTIVIGAGKAAASMAAAFEAAWQHDYEGVVVTRYGHSVPTSRIKVLEAAHPVPDAKGIIGADALLAAVSNLTADDLVIALISGGGSSVITKPAEGLTLEDLRDVNQQLLASGADIGAMNILRKHLSSISGGRLANACAPAKLVTIAISDVPGDDPAVIASGPTVLDPSTVEDAKAVIAKYNLQLAPHIIAALCESPKLLPASDFHLIATPMMSLKAAALKANMPYLILSDCLEGEARDVADMHAAIVKSVLNHGEPAKTPLLILSGGETTVTLKGTGRGGRNSEFLLALGIALSTLPREQRKRVTAIAIDTDGIDGIESNAGAFLPANFDALCKGLNLRSFLNNNDAWSLFNAIGMLITTGPTHTNVNDFRAILIDDNLS
jgi:glycerate 2-kinase